MSHQTPPPTEYLTTLRERIVARFNLEELRLLTFDLGVNYDDLRGETISSKIQALLAHLQQHDRIPDLLSQLQQQRPAETWQNYLPAEPEAVSPYKGLRFFDEADAPLFFGRERATAELVDHLRQYPFLAVVGASGSGKSSLVRAGVVPAVRRGEIVIGQSNSANWSIHTITPGSEPLKALAATLTRASESVTATKTLLADLQADSDSLDLFLYRQLSDQPDGRILLIVDQFEELFTQCDDRTARQLFVENLVTAVSGEQQRFSLILALRADFYAFAVQLERLRPLLETRQKIIGAMTPDELRQAITGPAEKGNWTLQPGLVETMLQDVGREPGALPLLSHALQETWARREGRTLTLAGYQAAGGVRRAIAQTADAVYAGLNHEQQTIARNIFLRLTELGEGTEDTRRRAALAELVPQGETDTAVQTVLDLLTQRRLVTLEEEVAEVSHEALIREWPELRRWLDENRAGLRLHRQLTEDAAAWAANDRDDSYLYRGARLEVANEWAETLMTPLTDLEQNFLTASQTHYQDALAQARAQAEREADAARKLRQRAIFLRGLLGVAVVLAVVAFLLYRQASNSANLAASNEAAAITLSQIAQSQALAFASLSVQEKDPMRGLLLAAAAGQTENTALTYDALHGAIPRLALPRHTWQYDAPVNGSRWNKDGSLILTWSADNTARLWETASGAERLRLSHDGGVLGAAWNGDNSLILTWSADNTARVWEATSGTERLRLSHEETVLGAAWNGDDSLILTWSEGGMARVWEAASGAERLRLSHDDWIYGAAWNADESLILTWSRDGTARVWEAASGAERLRLSHDGEVRGAAWNGDESLILTWGCDEFEDLSDLTWVCKHGTARVWDTASGAARLHRSYFGEVRGAAWNGDESLILTWSRDGTARVWEAASGAERLLLSHGGWSVGGAAWNGDESLILTWSDDGTARVWEAASGTERLRLSHGNSVRGAAWNGDESLILTWSWDNTARVWDAAGGVERLHLSHDREVKGAAWNEDDNLILTWSDDHRAQVWEATSGAGRLRLSHDREVRGAAWNEDDNLILTWSWDGTARVWKAASGSERLRLSHGSSVNGAAWNGDESLILTWSEDSTARVWEAASGAERLRLSHGNSVRGATWNGNESLILTWSRTWRGDGTARVWDAASGAERLRLSHDHEVIGAAWNKDESLILTWSEDGTARVWEATSGTEQMRFSHGGSVNGAAWNRDGSLILTRGCDELASFVCNHGMARVWEAASGTERLRLSHENWVRGAAWNGDESLILTWSADGTVRLWDAASGDERLRFSHVGPIIGAVWNGDESLILTWSGDGTARVWEAVTGAVVFTLMGDDSPVVTAQWSQDDRQILLVTEAGFAGIFYTKMADLLDVACQHATRNLTWTEWQLYSLRQPYRLICPQWPAHPSVPEGERP